MNALRFRTLALFVVGLVLGVTAASASAATIRVETAFDELDADPNCSLREAVQAANTNGDANPGCEDGEAGLDTIIFSGQPFAGLAGSGDDANATGDLDVTAAGGPLRIDGSALITERRIFDIDDDSPVIQVHTGGTLTVANLELNGSVLSSSAIGATAIASGNMTLENVEVTGGSAGDAGGIFAVGDLTLTNTTVTGNTASGNVGASGGAAGGGGIHQVGAGTLTLTNSVVSNNHATHAMGGGGGGIFHSGTGSLNITNSLITGNDTAGFMGGGVRAGGGTTGIDTTITGSTFSDNHTTNGASAFGAGGGLSWFGDAGEKLRVVSSTFSGNSSAGTGTWVGGGAIKIVDGDAAVVNSTLDGNSTAPGHGGALSGGAISDNDPTVAVINSTVAANTAASGDAFYSFDGAVTLRNSIVANGPSACFEDAAFGGDILTGGNGVDEGSSCDLDPAMGDAEGVSAGLGPLASNGGSTQTRAVLTGSPALDRVPPAACIDDLGAAMTTDQRGAGFARPVGPGCESGAYEAQPPQAAPPDSSSGAAKKCKKKKKRKRGASGAAKKKKKKCKRKRKRKRAS
jgi:CSLREA domain-containing protein